MSVDPENMRAGQITSRTNNGLEGYSELENTSYEYDSVGNITSITDNITDDGLNESQSFTYDKLYRLKTATASSLYGSLEYAFTAGGRLTKKGNISLGYSDTAHPQAVTSATEDGATVNYAYDLNGNMTSRAGRTLDYDSENRLTSVSDGDTLKQSYVYDESGSRIKKVREDGTVVYSIDGLYEVVRNADGLLEHTKYVHGIKGEMVAQITKNGLDIRSLAANLELHRKMVLAESYSIGGGRGLYGTILSAWKSAYYKTDFFLARYENAKIFYVFYFLLQFW